jgi:O-antigen/teichoic acid export membrane protein
LEYTILKKSQDKPSTLLGTTLSIELIIAIATTPLLIYIITEIYHESLHDFVWLAVGIFIPSFLSFVTRFVLLGTSDVRTVLIIDVIGTAAKFVTVFALLSSEDFGAFGILVSFLVQGAIVAGISLAVLVRRFGMRINLNTRYVMELIQDGLSNAPFKLSKVFIISLSVVLLGSFGVNNSEIGIFYIALMITVVVTSLSGSIAFMVIPASAEEKADLSSSSVRIGISLTAPLIAALITAPTFLLSLFGAQYISGVTVLLVLSVGALPFSITLNAISSFNNTGDHRKLVSVGTIEILLFLVMFWLLVPSYGTVGAALSMLVAFIASCIPSIIWSSRIFIKYVTASTVSIAAGSATGYLLGMFPNVHPILQLLGCVAVTITVIILLKNTTISEIQRVINQLLR